MRFLNILFVLMLSVACGKSASNGSSSAPRQQQTSDGPCLDADGIEIPSCDLLRADGNGYELLESMIDVPAAISASDITFHQSRMANDAGRRLKCETAVKDGEVLRYSMMGDTLEIFTPAGGKFSYHRLVPGADLKGVWVWNGRDQQGAKVRRQMTFLTGRMIIKTACEG